MQNQMYFGKVHQESLRQVLEFYYDDEKRHFMETDANETHWHIFHEISWLLNELDKHDRNVQLIEEHEAIQKC